MGAERVLRGTSSRLARLLPDIIAVRARTQGLALVLPRGACAPLWRWRCSHVGRLALSRLQVSTPPPTYAAALHLGASCGCWDCDLASICTSRLRDSDLCCSCLRLP